MLSLEKKASDKAVSYQLPVIPSLNESPFVKGILSLNANTEEVLGPNISTRPFELLQFIILINQKKLYVPPYNLDSKIYEVDDFKISNGICDAISIYTYKEDFDTVKSVFDSYVTPADEIEDLNRRGAYMHVLADALVSVLILIALILGMLFPKLAILDPLIGIIGGVIIARWALSLITESKNQLLGIN